ncbi:MAG: hypothetical protein JWN70_6215 [Planctomycetaceae bacterium]|nr:hypothetical protein [Planctomycetaceae bacterium]
MMCDALCSRSRQISGCVRRLTTSGACIFVCLLSWSYLPAAEPVAVPFELQPYRVRISLSYSESPGLEAALCKSILKDVPEISDRLLGEMWTVTTEENKWLFPMSAEHLARLTAEKLPADWTKETFDKTFLITLEHSGGEYLLSGREWDPVGRTLGNPISRPLPQRRELPSAVFRLAHDLFRPRLQVERITDGVASVTVQAGALTPADPTCAQLRAGQFWQPFLRYRNAQGTIEKLQAVPWTLLQVSEINPESRAHGQARVVSGLRSALPNRRRPRIDVLARALEPVAPETELRLISRQAPVKPLVGVVVDTKSKPDVPAVRMMTDRNGTIRIPARSVDPLLWLSVRSGEKTLARLPLVPGLEAQVTAELPDDSIRLRVEGELSILQSNLTDTVAQRAVLIARIRRLVQLGDWKSANELRTDLRVLPTTDNYLKELNAIRIPAVKTAQAAKDKGAAAYIERVCGEASKIIQKYLDDEKLKAFDEELKELERALPGAKKAIRKP